ncbi:MAG: hypothetical protein ACXVCY_18400 [Pseudobdellovibrionaceae bacterium]
MKLFKKTLPLLFVFSSLAFAATFISKEEVNQKIAEILRPYNDQNSETILKFKDLNVDEDRALDFGLNAFIAKQGLHNKAILKLHNISYHYGDGSNPTASGEVTLNMDMVKAFGQSSLDAIGENIEEYIKETAAEAGKKYGEAANIQVTVDDFQKDSEGHFESAQVRVSIYIDLNKLAQSEKVEDVEFKSLKIKFAVNRNLIRAKAQMVLNPLYKRFNKDQSGLKEFIEKLLNNDQELYNDINRTFESLNSIIQSIVDKEEPAN